MVSFVIRPLDKRSSIGESYAIGKSMSPLDFLSIYLFMTTINLDVISLLANGSSADYTFSRAA